VGPERLSLGEIRAGLADTFRFRLQPLIATITQTGATTDPKRLRVYVENQLAQARERQSEKQRRVETLQASLAAYTGQRQFSAPAAAGGRQPAADQAATVIPQVTDSFLDRIMDLSRQNSDVRYRQDMTQKIIDEGLQTSATGRDITHYEELLRRLPTGGSSTAESASIRTATKAVYDQVAKGMDQTNLFYSELSSQNLNTQAMLYTISDPFADVSRSALPLPSILMYGVLTFLLALFLVPLGCLAHHTAVGRRRQK
jgi:hypothetical protein